MKRLCAQGFEAFFSGVVAVLLVTIQSPSLGANDPGKERMVAESWLKILDSGDVVRAWELLDSEARQRVSKESWTDSIRGTRTGLGQLRQRHFWAKETMEDHPGIPGREVITVTYQAQFEMASGVRETVALIRDGGGEWTVGGYMVETDAGPGAKSMDFIVIGTAFYNKGDYPGAIRGYEKALELEKRSVSLSKDMSRALIDNLGMSYGLTGAYERALDTFRYGIQRDKTYPLFHYNVACTYAEMGDLETALASLKTAFSLRDNVIKGEKMPDPASDPSFARFAGDPRFQQVLKDLGLGRVGKPE